MRALVLDGSAALGLLMMDEAAPASVRAFEALEGGRPTFVPSHFALELANGLLMAERRRRITRAQALEASDVIRQLPIEVDGATGHHAPGRTTALAREYGLTVYDAAYLELALRRGATLATGDTALARAARRAGLDVI